MINNILEGDRYFGVVKNNPTSGGIKNVGVCVEVIRFQIFPMIMWNLLF